MINDPIMNKEGTGLWGGVLGKLLFCNHRVIIIPIEMGRREQGRGTFMLL